MGSLSNPEAADGAERFYGGPTVVAGEWYWVKANRRRDGEEGTYFACVVEIGSNYVEVRTPGGSEWRIHLDRFFTVATKEMDPRRVIDGEVRGAKNAIETTMKEIQALQEKLGVSPVTAVTTTESKEPAYALSTRNATSEDMKKYKADLIEAEETTLPKLFGQVKEHASELKTWLSADAITLESRLRPMRAALGAVEDRIFHVELYAGLTETVTQIRKGKPAPETEKVHLFQRRQYMDESCLIDYSAGGMEFKDIAAFDAWLLKPHNLAELLPHPRCVTIFQVRREKKDRFAASLIDAYINIHLEAADKVNFIYIRNGERVYRIRSELELREKLFPDQAEFDFSKPLYAYMFCSDVRCVVTQDRLDAMKEAVRQNEREKKAWDKAHPKKDHWHNPHRHRFMSEDDPAQYERFDDSNVHYDDIKRSIEEDMKSYNRIVLVLQGLFDRSEVFHPHPPARLWHPEGFEKSVKLVYDHDRALYAGPRPDFEAFRAELNRSLRPGSIVAGPWFQWEKRRIAKLEEDLYAHRNNRRYERYDPHPDPGPTRLSTVLRVAKGFVTIGWTRPRKRTQYDGAGRYWREAVKGKQAGDPEETTGKFEVAGVFNVSAYTPGDYRMFFADPRTRQDYLEWAPYMLMAEDFYGGKLKPDSRSRG